MEISVSHLMSMITESYGFQVAELQILVGEKDLNYLCRTSTEDYLLKVFHPDTSEAELDFQYAILEHLNRKELSMEVPSIINTLGNEPTSVLEVEENEYRCRIHTWIKGNMLGELKYHSPDLLFQWGKAAGEMSENLADFNHDFTHRSYKWNPSETLKSRKLIKYLKDSDKVVIADKMWNDFENHCLPKLKYLRKSVNHNDIHEMNTIIHIQDYSVGIKGVIDFGDALFTETINELAITCAYGMMNKPSPIDAACHIIKGYHSIFTVTEKELEVLFSLIIARLLISVSSAAENASKNPSNDYLQISESEAWELIYKLDRIHPRYALYRFREACNLEPVPESCAFINAVKNKEITVSPVIDFGCRISTLDLGMNSDILGNSSTYLEIDQFSKAITRYMEDEAIDLGIGGYGETRPFYTTAAYEVKGNEGVQWRTMHLGMDFWATTHKNMESDKRRTEIYSAVDGVVYSVYDNNAACDYGPTIILEHKYGKGLKFYTLYGHLSQDSLQLVKIGDEVKSGDRIAYLGESFENGGWPSHLHFQIILDLLDNKNDFPGVCYHHEALTWKSLCPNPALFFPELPAAKPIEVIPKEIILKERGTLLGKGLSVSYDDPLLILRAYKQYLYDEKGRRFLDTVNNVAHVGHEHPELVRIAQKQIAKLNTNTRYLHPNIIHYATKLLATFPRQFSVVYFVNSGSEANELALRIAKTVTKGAHIAAIEVGYHGNTGGTIDVSSYKFDGKGGNGKPLSTSLLPIPDVYRGKHANSKNPGQDYAAYIGNVITELKDRNVQLAGFIGESILSCGGQITLPKDYLRLVYGAVREAGGICIADEVQVGFGRVGKAFWGFELSEVIPDIVTVGKPIGNGHPLAAVVTTQEIADKFSNGMEYFNTFGGNPVSCAIGTKVLEIIEDENLQEQALEIGAYLMDNLKRLQNEYEIIDDVRGIGLFQGIELIRDNATKEPADHEAHFIVNRMRQRGILMSHDGPFHNVLKIKPPMCFTKENVDFLVSELSGVLDELQLFT